MTRSKDIKNVKNFDGCCQTALQKGDPYTPLEAYSHD